jgi:PKD repeat protein
VLLRSKYLNPVKFALTAALASITVIGLPAAMAQQFVFNPTTTLSAQTANNTSAASSFTALSNGDPASGNVSKLAITNLLYPGATTAIYAQFQPWFGQSSHINVGYNSDDPTQVHNQVTDMLSRGISGAIVDWYGPDAAVENGTTLLIETEAESRNGSFVFAVQEDVGALSTCATTSGCDITQQIISDLTYVSNTYEISPAYMTVNGRPAVFFFGVDKYTINWPLVRSSVPGDPYFIFIGTSGLNHPDADGYFAWVIIDTSNPNDESLSVLSTFYSGMQALPGDLTYGTSYIGFNESLAPWVKSNPRIMNQHCGQTWLDTFGAVAGAGYSASNQLQAIQIVTWNDYEEGTEIETGISNCITISPSINGTSLQWAITGNEKAVDHYAVFISLDGQQLMNLASVAAGTHTLGLSTYNLVPNTTYQLFVEAIGAPSVQNQMSAPVGYMPQAQPVNAVLTLSATGGTAPLSISASTKNSSSPNVAIISSTINFGDGSPTVTVLPASLAAGHTYNSPGTFTVTAMVTDSVGATASTTQQVTVSPATPTAALSVSPSSGAAPLSVLASLANSSSPDGTISSGTLNFGDGSATVTVLPASLAAGHTYSSPGTFTVAGTVTDSNGVKATATQQVTVARAVPTAVLTVTPLSGKTSLKVTASLAGSSPDATISSGTLNFGDGSATVTVLTASHTYYVPGNFTVTGTVTDSLGATASATKSVTVTQGCAISSTNRGITICSPAANSSVTSPVQIVAYATDSKAITQMIIYVDGKQVYAQQTSAKLVNTAVNISAGTHTITVKAWESSTSFSKSIAVKVP